MFALPFAARADLALETETARLLPAGHVDLSAAFEFQTSRDGREYAAPLALEFGIFDRLELLIEPVAITSIQPKSGPSATGLGDTEVTLTFLAVKEQPFLPALAFAGEVKFPTARNLQIGSREFDYRVYAVVSKRLDDVDLHFNLGYNIITAPPGLRSRNPIDLELAAEWFFHPRFDLLAEVTYVGSSLRGTIAGEIPAAAITSRLALPTSSKGGGAITPELAGREIVGTVGIRSHITRNLDLFGTFSYDNNDAKLFRTGITLKY